MRKPQQRSETTQKITPETPNMAEYLLKIVRPFLLEFLDLEKSNLNPIIFIAG